MFCHCLCITIPLSLLLTDGDDAWLSVVYIIAFELIKCQGNGGINFVFHNYLVFLQWTVTDSQGKSAAVHCYNHLHRYVTMLLGGQRVTLGSQLGQSTTDAETGVARLNHIVNVAILGSLIRIGEQFVVLILLLGDEGLDILAGFLLGLGFLGIEHSSGTGGTHHCNLCGGPCGVQVGVQLLGAHHDV